MRLSLVLKLYELLRNPLTILIGWKPFSVIGMKPPRHPTLDHKEITTVCLSSHFPFRFYSFVAVAAGRERYLLLAATQYW